MMVLGPLCSLPSDRQSEWVVSAVVIYRKLVGVEKQIYQPAR